MSIHKKTSTLVCNRSQQIVRTAQTSTSPENSGCIALHCNFCNQPLSIPVRLLDSQNRALPQYSGKVFPDFVVSAGGWVYCNHACAIYD
jgi:hypothetical protein